MRFHVEQGASLMLMSHLGRPKGGADPEFSLRAASEALATLLNRPVQMAPDCVGAEVEALAKALKPGDVLMLENTRFHKGEEKNDLELAKQMAALGEVYVNDAFGSAHRAHSSTEGIARFLPAVSGFLMEQELEYLGRAVANPEHPYVAILGGAKISDKILVVETLASNCDKLIIGGGMARYIIDRASAGMIGVNVGVPVPREPFSFGGWNESKFGVGDITGKSSIEFWTKLKKSTTKWNAEAGVNWMS